MRVVQGNAFVLGQIPIGKQLDFAAQHRFVVSGQHARFGGQLPSQQAVGGGHVLGMVGLRVISVDAIHHRVLAQVAHEHETVGFVPGQDLGHQQTGLAQQSRDVHKRAAVFMRRWGIHDDQAVALLVVDAQVAAKAGVGRGGAQTAHYQSVLSRLAL